MTANKDDITPEDEFIKGVFQKYPELHFLYFTEKWEPFKKFAQEYATIQAGKAWDAAVSYESQRDNFLNFCKPITAPNKEKYLQSLK